MKYLNYILLIFLFHFSFISFAQKNTTVSGKVFDKKTGETLINAVVYDEKSKNGSTTNNEGFYSIELNEIPGQIIVSYVGYKSVEIECDTSTAIKNIFLETSTKEMDEIVVRSVLKNLNSSQISSFLISKNELLKLPSLASESDLNLYLQLTPGVSSGGDGNSNLYVRGGSHDQNLYLLDDMPLFHVGHFGGFFSTFNSDIINSATLYKGGFPARFGGRLSSVVDIHTYNGDLYNFNGRATLGLLFSKLSINGPIQKGRSSYYLTVRKNTLPIFKLLTDENIDFNFFDINLKVNFKLSERDKIFFSLYSGNDYFGNTTGSDSILLNKNNMSWGNLAASIRYNRVFSNRFFGNFILGHSKYHYNEYELAFQDSSSTSDLYKYENNFESSISCEFLKTGFEFSISNNLRLNSGYEFNLYRYQPGISHLIFDMPIIPFFDDYMGYEKCFSVENNLYAELTFNEIRGFSGILGLRPSHLHIPNKNFISLQPRIALSYNLFKNLKIKSSFTQMSQAFHVLSSKGAGFLNDYRIPVTDYAPPSLSSQFVFGITFNPGVAYEFSAELYSKKMNNLVYKKQGVRYNSDFNEWSKTIENKGLGESKGIEILMRKCEGRLTGWIGLTIAKSLRQFNEFNNGNAFYFDYDRTNELNIFGQYSINKKVNIGATWTFATGIPANIPSHYFSDINSNTIFYYSDYNSYRQRDYHRLDLSLNLKGEKGDWNIAVINVYNRKNSYYYNVSIVENKPVLETRSLFGVIPSISYSFKF
jgi:hypothetical protein